MHELSLTQSLVEIAVDHAQREKAREILSITIEIGSLSGTIPEAVEFAAVCRIDAGTQTVGIDGCCPRFFIGFLKICVTNISTTVGLFS